MSRQVNEGFLGSKPSSYPQFFNPERLGQSLKEVSSDLLRVESRDLVGRWFHAANEIDLFLWCDDHRTIVKQQRTLLGQVVEWNIIEGTKTGAIIEEEGVGAEASSSGGPMKASEMIRFDTSPQTQPIGLAMDVIKHTGALSSVEQKQIISNFFRGQKLSEIAPAEFLAKYAAWGASPLSLRLRVAARVVRFLRRVFRGA